MLGVTRFIGSAKLVWKYRSVWQCDRHSVTSILLTVKVFTLS